ncbi:MAG: SpoIVB peptidase [Oscillospiraceae bacterium]|jgi:stage IV sporulation protein B|nr:SpoIVB peptidase [Oscillospiraceae bacterium]
MKQTEKFVKTLTIAACLVSMAILSIAIYLSCRLPDEFYLHKGDRLSLGSSIVTSARPFEMASPAEKAPDTQKTRAELAIFGLIPLKEVDINYIDDIMVVPCGNAFGVKMFTDGVIVVGTGKVDGENGLVNPADIAGIRLGDVIVSIDGQKMSKNEQVGEIISQSGGRKMVFIIRRNGAEFSLVLCPVRSLYDQAYRGGLWVRDSSAGIGTMTYFNKSSGTFGGLGHPICDVETGEILPLMSGEIVEVDINGVKKGANGAPGELRGTFSKNGAEGILLLNTETGVFGTLDINPGGHEEVPLGLRQEIQEGAATILCTIDGEGPKEYAINIEKVDLTGASPTKNMVLRITDPVLLERTGGIVQGMSGSPILQGGKLIGAVTHVFVNDSAKGYGIFAENMIRTAAQLEKTGVYS